MKSIKVLVHFWLSAATLTWLLIFAISYIISIIHFRGPASFGFVESNPFISVFEAVTLILAVCDAGYVFIYALRGFFRGNQ